MKLYTIASLLIIASIALGESPNERELNEIQSQRQKAITAASEAIEEKYTISLKRLLRAAMDGQDVDATSKIIQALEDAGDSSATLAPADSLPGRWLFRSEDWYGERRFTAYGSVNAGVDGFANWTVVGNELRVDYLNGNGAIFALPVRHGRLTGKTLKGFEITAEKLVK
jgi:hypothetical protein